MTDPDSVVFHDETLQVSEPGSEELVVFILGVQEQPISYRLPRRGTLRIGRGKHVDIRVPDSSVSRVHAELEVHDGSLAVVDIGSVNGVRIRNRRLVEGERTPLSVGEPIELGHVVLIVHRPTLLPHGAPEIRPPHEIPEGPVVQDETMRRVHSLIGRVASSNLSVLLLGETGVGKGVIAAEIHRRSTRQDGPFVQLNASALSETLLESELFGHERGAFTGANRSKQGLLEAAHGGTVFLDEIGDMPMSLQPKLLRVLEDRKVLRVGGLKEIPIDVRFVAATNRDLSAEVERGRFRQDLFYRINGMAIEIPPLRKRKEELIPLAEHFLEVALTNSGRSGEQLALSPRARSGLLAYDWPGNIRQLRNALERAVILAADGIVELEHLPDEVRERGRVSSNAPLDVKLSPAEQEERQRIVEALEAHAGNQTRAADFLGISRRTLVKRLDTYRIPRPRKR